MTEPILDDKGKEIPATPVPGEDGKKPIDTDIQKQIDEGIVKATAELTTKLEVKTLQADQLTVEVGKLRKDNKQPLLAPVLNKPEPKVDLDDDLGDDKDFDTQYRERRTEEKKEEYKTRVERVFDKFLNSDGIELDGTIDSKFRSKANRMHLGDTDEEVMENLTMIYTGLKPKPEQQPKDKDKDKEDDINIGDGGNEVTPKKSDSKWATKKLNKFEEAAAEHFPGGEKPYREKMQKLEDKKGE